MSRHSGRGTSIAPSVEGVQRIEERADAGRIFVAQRLATDQPVDDEVGFARDLLELRDLDRQRRRERREEPHLLREVLRRLRVARRPEHPRVLEDQDLEVPAVIVLPEKSCHEVTLPRQVRSLPCRRPYPRRDFVSMEPSEEIRRVIERWIAAVTTGDGDAVMARVTEHPGSLLIGSDANEWWEGDGRVVFQRQLAESEAFP